MIKKRVFYLVSVIVFLLILLNINNIIFLFNLSTDQINLISKSKSLEIVIENNLEEESLINQLRLVPDIMQFGDSVGFPETDSYSKYIRLNRSVLYYSLSASKKDKLEDYSWWWPIIGRIPYKGFIYNNDALEEAKQLKSQGYDTYIGKSNAMSTLGVFPDSIITTMINKSDPTVLINSIFHERTHELFFKKNDINFNENSAVLLGELTALEFIRQKFGEDSKEYLTQLNRIHDTILFSDFIEQFYNELSELYSSDLSSQEKVIQRELLFDNYIEKFKLLKEDLNESFKDFDEKQMNNAYFLSYYRYYGKFHDYYSVYVRLDKNLIETIQFFNNTAHTKKDSDAVIRDFLQATNNRIN